MAKELQLLTGTSRDRLGSICLSHFSISYFQMSAIAGSYCQQMSVYKVLHVVMAQTPVMTRRVAFGTEMFGINSTFCTCITKMH